MGEQTYSLNQGTTVNSGDLLLVNARVTNFGNRTMCGIVRMATGAYMNTSTEYYGNGWWWLRSPRNSYSYSARDIRNSGYADDSNNVSSTNDGVVPALKIRLS